MLSEKQHKILEMVRNNPKITLKQMATALGITASSAVHVQIKKLIDMNFLVRKGHSLTCTDRDENEFTPIPYYGLAQCGDNDVFSLDRVVDYINMPTQFLPTPTSKLFFIKAQGDSMEPTIHDGDILMFRKTDGTIPPENSIVFCQRGDGLKIKRLRKAIENVNPQYPYRLTSDNKNNYDPFPVDESVRIFGQLVQMTGNNLS